MDGALDAILRDAGVWRGLDPATPTVGRRLPSGWPRLDAALAGGGWPLGTLIEVCLPAHGLGELQLFLPALRQLGRDGDGAGAGWTVWVSPPHEPYPPALAQSGLLPASLLRIDAPAVADRLWATEQVLRSASAAAVLCWLEAADGRWLRRLKLAAEGQSVLLVVFRPLSERAQASPAALRLVPVAAEEGLAVDILKDRGRAPSRVMRVLDC